MVEHNSNPIAHWTWTPRSGNLPAESFSIAASPTLSISEQWPWHLRAAIDTSDGALSIHLTCLLSFRRVPEKVTGRFEKMGIFEVKAP